MTNEDMDSRSEARVDDMRDELKDQLLRAAYANKDRQRGRMRRLGLSAAVVLAAAIPGTLAVAGLMPDDEPQPQPAPPPLFAPGGAYADCPREVQELLTELDDLSEYAQTPGYPVAGCPTIEAIEETIPTTEETMGALVAPGGPFFAPGGTYADCPLEVQEFLRELDDPSDYAQGPGYPVAGCPTLEAIEELLPTPEEARGADTFRGGARGLSPER